MRLHEIQSGKPSWKAGGLPFWIDETGQVHVVLVTSTDPAYNGPDPCIPKGRAEIGETPEQCGLREVWEETGIDSSHIAKAFLIATENVTGLTRSYDFHVFAYQCKDKSPIRGSSEGTPQWYTADEAITVIRDIHKPFLMKLLNKI